MVYVDAYACWVANAVFFIAGMWAALMAAHCVRCGKYRPMLWLLPGVLMAAWLESAFSSGIVGQAMTAGFGWSILWRHMLMDLFKWAMLSAVFVAVRYAKSPLSRG